jgi:hypothetical protein
MPSIEAINKICVKPSSSLLSALMVSFATSAIGLLSLRKPGDNKYDPSPPDFASDRSLDKGKSCDIKKAPMLCRLARDVPKPPHYKLENLRKRNNTKKGVPKNLSVSAEAAQLAFGSCFKKKSRRSELV